MNKNELELLRAAKFLMKEFWKKNRFNRNKFSEAIIRIDRAIAEIDPKHIANE